MRLRTAHGSASPIPLPLPLHRRADTGGRGEGSALSETERQSEGAAEGPGSITSLSVFRLSFSPSLFPGTPQLPPSPEFLFVFRADPVYLNGRRACTALLTRFEFRVRFPTGMHLAQ
jgi:hypothetical protein